MGSRFFDVFFFFAFLIAFFKLRLMVGLDFFKIIHGPFLHPPPAHRRATQRHTEQTTLHTLISTCTMVQLVALLPSCKKVMGLTPSQGFFCMEVCMFSPCMRGVLWLPPTVQKHDCKVDWVLSIALRYKSELFTFNHYVSNHCCHNPNVFPVIFPSP
ncbi:hypothetical protein AMECASPLE_002330 [Ameca splendens]|uniref:Secreted protein n=1 Tax=Ameca splendens TaxID=208324 RepID=A0ABV0ZUX5_9TELE